jgi:hypothetical protein
MSRVEPIPGKEIKMVATIIFGKSPLCKRNMRQPGGSQEANAMLILQ